MIIFDLAKSKKCVMIKKCENTEKRRYIKKQQFKRRKTGKVLIGSETEKNNVCLEIGDSCFWGKKWSSYKNFKHKNKSCNRNKTMTSGKENSYGMIN